MQAWIARDGDGEYTLYLCEPEWSQDDEWWEGSLGIMCPDALLSLFPLEPGYCQPITLNATPTGEPTKGTP